MSHIDASASVVGSVSYGATISGTAGSAHIVLNDWDIAIEAIDGGHRLIARRGSSSQSMDIMDGEPGAAGEQGETGPQGPQGEPGADFAVGGIYASLAELVEAHPSGRPGEHYAVGTSADNEIYAYNEQLGEWQSIGKLQGPQGETGPQGPQGEPGTAATITVGTVESVEPDVPASVKNAGTDNAAVLNFRIPRGEKGDSASLDTPVPIKDGGTGASDAANARTNLGVTRENLGAAAESHKHTASEITSGILPVARGGTGASDAAGARTNLGAAAEGHTHALTNAAITGTLPVSKGGTGATDAAGARTNLGVTPGNIGAAAAEHDHADKTIKPIAIEIDGVPYPYIDFHYDGTDEDYTSRIIELERGTLSVNPTGKVILGTVTWGVWNGVAIPVSNGGTGATTKSAARKNLGVEIQVGTETVGTSGTTITFDEAFSGVPVVTANGKAQTSIRVYDITATGCTLVSGESNNTVQWQAIYISN